MKTFLMTWDAQHGATNQITRFLDTIPQVKNWVIINQCSALVTAVADAFFLAQRVREKFPGLHHIISETSPGTADGLLQQIIWDHINNPRSSGYWRDEGDIRSLIMPNFTDELKLKVWTRGRCIPQYAPEVWRWDISGRVMKFSEHGNRSSEHGWEIDHVVPISKGGTDDVSNLLPVNWKTNQERGAPQPTQLSKQ